jgi:N-acetylmuramoyl-L-alanine amidase
MSQGTRMFRLFILIWVGFFITPSVTYCSQIPFRVVIDPGHGGSDEGTVFENEKIRIAEKTVTLQLARKVAQQLKRQGYEVTLTRNQDREVPLPHRTALANRLKADVFISLHMNSTQTLNLNDAEGVETFILNNATDASSRRLARLENALISQEKPGSPQQWDVALILKDLRLDANLAKSKQLACQVQSKLVSATSNPLSKAKRNRGVRQALFHVLLGADMPSVLVEAGFLNSHHDRKFILSPKGQTAMSKAISEAIDLYRKQKESPRSTFSLHKCKIN